MRYLLTVSICWVALYAIYHLFLRKETFFHTNRAYLLGSLILGALIPCYHWLPVGWLVQEEVVTSYIVPIYQLQATVFVTAADAWTWVDALWFLYAVGVMVAMARLLHGVWQIYQLRDESVQEYISGVRIIRTASPHLPFSFGSAVYISDVVDLEIDVEQLIRHEQVHISSRHTIDVLIVEVLKVFFWFNPILILYKKALQQAHEYVADAMVIKDISRKSYGQLLLRQSQSGMEIALANHFFHSQIKKRIQMMYQQQSKRSAMVKYLAAVPVLLALMVFFSAYYPSDKDDFESQLYKLMVADMPEDDRIYGLLGLVKAQEDNGADMHAVMELMAEYGVDVVPDNDNYSMCHYFDRTAEKLAVVQKQNALRNDTIPSSELSTAAAEGVIEITTKAAVSEADLPEINVVGYGERSNQHISKGEMTVKSETDNPNIYKKVDIMPAFPGCEEFDRVSKEFKICSQEKMLRYIYTNVKYPSAAREAGEEGMIVVQFVVDPTGKISTSQIVKNVGDHGLGAAAMKVVDQMRSDITWLPGIEDGKAVSVLYTLPIRFKLQSGPSKDVEASLAKPAVYVNGEYHGDNADDVDPDDIVEIKVLKGEKATAKYGDKGANGVIEITLKPGSELQQPAEQIHKVVDIMPAFPGCEDLDRSSEEFQACSQQKMLHYIYTNVKYPAAAREAGEEGMTVVQFVIDKSGQVMSPKVVRDVGANGLGDAALGVVQLMQSEITWNPGIKDGKEVSVMYTLPIKFKLTDDDVLSERSASEGQAGITLRPNPSSGAFTIDFEGISGTVQVEVKDLAGRTVYEQAHMIDEGQNAVELASDQFSAMSAVVTVRSGKEIYTQKIIFN